MIILLLIALMTSLRSSAQGFINLYSDDMRIDSTLPETMHFFSLPRNHKDSAYTLRLLYPEYTPLTRRQRKRYRNITGSKHAPTEPQIRYDIVRERTDASLCASIMPVVEHNGRLCFLSSFLPQLQSEDAPSKEEPVPVYAANSVLAQGKWAKVAVLRTGIHELTKDIISKAGFTDLTKVKIYGYGGNMVPERLTQEYLCSHDDLHEIPTCTVDGRKYFYAYGPVAWPEVTAAKINHRQRNPYADYGCYFITQTDGDGLTVSESDLLRQWMNSADAHHTLYEKDEFVWLQTGRRLFDKTEILAGKSATYYVPVPQGNSEVKISVAVAANSRSTASVSICSKTMGKMSFGFSDYDAANVYMSTYTISAIDTLNTKDQDGNILIPVNVDCTSGGPLHLDYIATRFDNPASVSTLAAASKESSVVYVGKVANQNHHADTPTDLIIIVPSSLKLLEQAQRLAQFHLDHDGISSRIVSADALYNEFSSGTPDASAYRRYLKMFYDKATDEKSMPKNVLLFGDAVWDARRCYVSEKTMPFHDYLLCYEAEDTTTRSSDIIANISLKYSMASDDFFTVLQDGKTLTDMNMSDVTLRFDIGIGRLPVSTPADAKVVVDKIIHYVSEGPSGSWQNDIMFIGDDGDNNSHMRNINANADATIVRNAGYNIKKVMADAYECRKTSVGDRYPDVTKLLMDQQNQGALMINYGGHGSAVQLSHEIILALSDIDQFKGKNYPLWFTAACETAPYDIPGGNLGENMLLKEDGGAIAFYGTTRTVLESYNAIMNSAFTRNVLSSYDDQGNPLTLGEAQRRAKNEITAGGTASGRDATLNKHHYNLLGDPAMSLALPRCKVVIDSIGNKSTSEIDTINGGGIVTVVGHITNYRNQRLSEFDGTATVIIRDGKTNITCRDNDGSADNPFVFTDRTTTLYKGTCQVEKGRFSFTFRMSNDFSADGNTGLITVYAIDPQRSLSANGESQQFCAMGWQENNNDNIGPSIYAYLNTPEFQNGGSVGATPFFVAEVMDGDGINATSASIGHNMQLVIDGRADMTYDLDDNFTFDAGSYTNGTTWFVLPELSNGTHTLSFRAWDLFDNSNSVDLTFNVNKTQTPVLYDISVNPNPVQDEAIFYLHSDMQGSTADIYIDIIDTSGKLIRTVPWRETLAGNHSATQLRWNAAGLSPGLYLYRARISCDGHNFTSKTKKLIKN